MDGRGVDGALLPDAPLPDYARIWGGPGLRWALLSELPNEYDRRISTTAIFVIPKYTEVGRSSPRFVVARSCARCKTAGQQCCRSIPCTRCVQLGAPCMVTEPGLEELPVIPLLPPSSGDALKGTKRKRAPKLGEKKAKERRVVSAPAAQSCVPQPPFDFDSVPNGGIRAAASVNPVDASVIKGKRGRPRKSLDSLKTTVMQTDTQKKAEDIQKDRSKMDGGTVRRKRMELVTERTKSCDSGWTVTAPSTLVATYSSTPKPLSAGLPHIWADSKEDVLTVLPNLAESLNGVSWVNSASPTLLLDGPFRPGDTWINDKIEICMIREHVFAPPQQPSTPAANGVDADLVLLQDVDGFEDSQSSSLSYFHPTARLLQRGLYSSCSTIPELDCNYTQVFSEDPVGSAAPPLLPQHDAVQFVEPCFTPRDSSSLSQESLPAWLDPSIFRSLSNEPAPLHSPPPPPWPYASNTSLIDTLHPSTYYESSVDHAHNFRPPNTDLSLLSQASPTSSIEQLHYSPPLISNVEQWQEPVYHPLDDSGQGPSNATPPFISSDPPGPSVVHESPKAEDPVVSDDSLPQPLPSDILVLLECQKQQMPISIIMSRDCSLAPFSLPEQYGCVFLGFFHVTAAVRSTGFSPFGSHSMRVCWKFVFEWIPGGESLDPERPSALKPWWTGPLPTTMNAEAVKSEEEDTVICHPYTLLPPYFTVAQTPDGTPLPLCSPNALTRKGWHCLSCGKLNVQRMLCVQDCGYCKASNGMTPINVVHVRNTFNLAPLALPWDRYPTRCVFASQHETRTGHKSFTYTLNTNATVTHLFTGNEHRLQELPSKLWMTLQKDVPLKWQSVNSALAAGPYYTFFSGRDQQPRRSPPMTVAPPGLDPCTCGWHSAPGCLVEAISFIQQLARERWSDNFSIDEITMLAWLTSGNRKSPTPLPAKSKKVGILCLGADVELTLMPQSGFKVESSGGTQLLQSTSYIPQNASKLEEDFDDCDPMDEDHEDASLAGLLRPPAPSPNGNIPLQREVVKKDDFLFLTLVHGDMVLLEGDNFNWSMRRTGMSIVTIAT
ncbi:hypothetical protein BXZ70DRAFT_1005661 [Cristinia sonorae]|uniref:Zn(2)-C6 fungal-type domain-containing protein n=1 Tax=Cristinia sonorae TaxID=1940300 RepID=A0A8K0XSM1_9AGAR|nr:hypothetical protein BXZ70DRAFT_1005661 [Cristinia sonorae]